MIHFVAEAIHNSVYDYQLFVKLIISRH